MAKLTLTDLTQLSSNESSAVAAINANNALIEALAEGLFSLDGTAPNTIAADIDMDGTYTLINLPDATNNAEPVTLRQLTASADGIVNVKDEGTTIVAAATDLDFVGSGVTVTDGGSGMATITIPYQTFLNLTDTPSSFTAGQLYRVNSGATALEAIGIGTEGQVLTVSSGVPVWANNTGASIWERIDRTVFSAQTSVTIGGAQTPSDYDLYWFIFNNITVSTDGAIITVLASTDGGSTTESSYTRQGSFWRSAASDGDFGSESSTLLSGGTAIDTGSSNKDAFYEGILHAPGSSSHKRFKTNFSVTDNASVSLSLDETDRGIINSTNTIDSFVLSVDTGTMSGTGVLLGLKKTG